LAISAHGPVLPRLNFADFQHIGGGTILARALGMMMTQTDTRHAVPTGRSLRKVMVVGNNPHHRVLETVANTGSYDVVIVESTARAYSHIKRVVPTLVVLCLGLDDPDACHVLSMLKLDSATSTIPVVTYSMAMDGLDETADPGGDEITLVVN